MTFFIDESVIRQIVDHDIPELVEQLPYDCWHNQTFTKDGDHWCFEFECNFVSGRFSASAKAEDPREAFASVRTAISEQLSRWHQTRFQLPKILIVEDDIDQAKSLEGALIKAGWQTEIATGYEDLHRRIVDSDHDFILLDWRLNGEVTADRVVTKAVRLIEAFADLREKFRLKRPRIVTNSVLERSRCVLPDAGREYFNYVDHWQKPMPFQEVLTRASGLASK